MKLILALMLLIGSNVKGQDSALHLGIGHVETIEFMGADSIGICGYQKPDSPFVVVGDSARLIKVLVESLDHTGKFHLRWPIRWGGTGMVNTRILKLMPGKGTVMELENDTVYSRIDTVKWTPYYYQKKKHHLHNIVATNDDIQGALEAIRARTDTSWFMDYQKRHPGMYDKNGKPVLGGIGMPNTTIIPKDSQINAITSTKWIRDTLSMWNGAQIWEHPISIAYPLWKKALWVLLGIIICALVWVGAEIIKSQEEAHPFNPN